MIPDDTQRRLCWHGVFLLLLGLLTGALVPVVTNPRMGLSAHLAGVQNGIVLVLFGLIWQRLSLTERGARAAFQLSLFSMYAIWVATLLGAIFGTSRAAPIAGAGYHAAAWQEVVVSALLGTGAAAILVAATIVLYGLRRSIPSRAAAA